MTRKNLFLKNVKIQTAPLLSHPHYYAAGSGGFLAALGQIADTGGTSERKIVKERNESRNGRHWRVPEDGWIGNRSKKRKPNDIVSPCSAVSSDKVALNAI
jgi:hypothetical protein